MGREIGRPSRTVKFEAAVAMVTIKIVNDQTAKSFPRQGTWSRAREGKLELRFKTAILIALIRGI